MIWRYIKRVLKVNDDKDLAHLLTSTVCSSIFSCPESGVEGIGKENEDEDGIVAGEPLGKSRTYQVRFCPSSPISLSPPIPSPPLGDE